ncbi:DHA2 family efflux MFS transporter permease subunit [Thauera sinica]|uniref:DHA2 family efflux MFS transporter permease subunit n=1 Tax=Thauera sinica TaxID=2665146 RepID=A0ABW1ALM3_9RHOO|nr:DHA2 family efflux MFS transporter permease subunit [Thauera sp. K11]ATE60903.1 MFS transporter [Thauera sp. K11]
MYPLPRAVSFDALSQRHGKRYKWLVLLVAGLGVIAGVLSTTSFSVAVPALMRQFGLGQEQVQWTMTGYMAAMTVGMLPTPWILDRLGFRKLFLGAIVLLAVTSIAGSLATDYRLVVAMRILQGMAAGVLQPMGTLAVVRLFPDRGQGRASGILGFGIVLAPAVAPSLGGVLLDHFGWPAIFLINLPACLLAGLLGLYLLPLPREVVRHKFDWPGVALLTVSTLAIVEGIASLQHSGPAAGWTLLQFGLAALAVGGFVLHARRARHPIISIGLFRRRSFSMGTLVSFAYGFGLFGSSYLIPVFLQHALHFSATAAGTALLPSGIVLALTIPLAGRMADRHSPQAVTIAGLVLFCLSFVFFGVVAGHITYLEIIAATILGRVGLGLILPALSMATLRHLEPHHLSQSSVVISYVRQLGGVLGIAMAAVFVSWRETVRAGAADGVAGAYADGFMMIAGVFLVALAAACLMKEKAPR